jgi:hypothetical protein
MAGRLPYAAAHPFLSIAAAAVLLLLLSAGGGDSISASVWSACSSRTTQPCHRAPGGTTGGSLVQLRLMPEQLPTWHIGRVALCLMSL